MFWSPGVGVGLIGGLPRPRRACEDSTVSLELFKEVLWVRFPIARPLPLTGPTTMSSILLVLLAHLPRTTSQPCELRTESVSGEDAMELVCES